MPKQNKENEEKVQKIGNALATIAKSEEFTKTVQDPNFQLVVKSAIAFVILAIKRYNAKTGVIFSANSRDGFLFALGYLLGRQAYEITKTDDKLGGEG